MFVFVFIEVNVRGQVKKAFELNALFLQIHSSGSLWLLNAVFVIPDSSGRMDWPWCYRFVKETTLCAPTLTLWLTQSYILTHARAFNIESRILGLKLRRLISISWCDSLIGVDKSCIFAVFRGILMLWETIYANNDTAKYTATIDSYISGLVFYLSMLARLKEQIPRHRVTRILLYLIDLITL